MSRSAAPEPTFPVFPLDLCPQETLTPSPEACHGCVGLSEAAADSGVGGREAGIAGSRRPAGCQQSSKRVGGAWLAGGLRLVAMAGRFCCLVLFSDVSCFFFGWKET